MPLPSPPLHAFSPDLAQHIFSHLSPRDLSTSACVSRTWRQLALDEHLWRRFIRAPPGQARMHYLRDSAWRSARALHSITPDLPSTPHAVQLLPHGHLLAMTLSAAPRAAAQWVVAPCGARLLQPARMLRAEPVCVRARYCSRTQRVLVAYGYRNGFVALYAVQEQSGMDCTPRHVLLSRTPGREAVTCVDILLNANGPTVVAGTSTGALAFTTRLSRSGGADSPVVAAEMQSISLSQYAVGAIAASVDNETVALVGTAGGEVITFDVASETRLRYYVGPCSCGVTAVEFATTGVLVAGFAHRVLGNGHRSAAVAWDKCAGARLAAFGRGSSPRSSAAFPTAAVSAIRADGESGRRVGLLVGGQARVYDVGTWRCEVEAEFGGAGRGIDMDEARLALACGGGDGGVVHVLDFEEAVQRMPVEVGVFKPDGGAGREWGSQSI